MPASVPGYSLGRTGRRGNAWTCSRAGDGGGPSMTVYLHGRRAKPRSADRSRVHAPSRVNSPLGINQYRIWPPRRHISYCDWSATRPKFLNNHSTMAAAAQAGPGRGANMSTILSLLGIAVTAAGVAAIGFGIPINEFTLGTTLIVAGVSAFTGGLVLIGLATVVAELGRLREAIRARPIARP